MTTPSMFGPEWDTGGWMYVALDQGGSHVIKVGYTTDPRQRGKAHRRWGLTTVVQWVVASELTELEWHHDHRRYRRRTGDPDTRTRVELYDPHRAVVDDLLMEVERAHVNGECRWMKGWNIGKLYEELDVRAAQFLADDQGWA